MRYWDLSPRPPIFAEMGKFSASFLERCDGALICSVVVTIAYGSTCDYGKIFLRQRDNAL